MKNIKQTFLVILFLSFSFFFVSRANATGETCAQISGRVAAQCQKGESSGWSGLWATKCPGDMNACAYYNNLQCGSCPTSGDVCCTTDAIVQSATTPNSSAGATTNPLPANQAGARADSTSSGMIPCTNNCTLCHLVIGFKRIFNFFIGLLFVATMLAITVSGVFYMVSSGSKPIIEMAKKGITYSLMAFVIGMGGWLLINTVMIGLGFKHPYGGNWWEFTCDTSQTVGPVSTGNAPNWSTGSGTTQFSGKGCEGVAQNILAMEGWNYAGEKTGTTAKRMDEGWADCSSSAFRAYQAAGCNLPQNDSRGYAAMGTSIGDPSALKVGDIVAYPGHVVTCLNNGCSRVMSANTANGIFQSNGASYYNRSDATVIHASQYCPGC